jgi:hypothetical protein
MVTLLPFVYRNSPMKDFLPAVVDARRPKSKFSSMFPSMFPSMFGVFARVSAWFAG